ncbi:MAG: hypothetical protein KGL95_10045, partial [Patescibacteria group bacterium]|nr:hypothetical protein [Patescibacteria group bacterium]
DCSKVSEWEKQSSRLAQALRTILEFKQVINQTRNGRIENPIGIVLTKSDTLQNPDEDAKIVCNKMKRFLNTLASVHDGKVEFFKLHVDIDRNTDNAVNNSSGLKVRKPLTYSHKEYARLIDWILKNI